MQYSKRLATFICLAWLIFRVLSLAAMTYQPEITSAIKDWVSGVDSVMFANIGFYSGNSVSEKFILAHYKTRVKEIEEEKQKTAKTGNDSNG